MEITKMAVDEKTNRSLKTTMLQCMLLGMLLGTVFLVTRFYRFSPVHIKADSTIDRNGKSGPHEAFKILLVHSYHAGYPWTDTITRGVCMALAGQPATMEVFYMDTKRRTGELWKQEAGAQARRIVAEWHPDVIIAADDNAQQYFAKDYAHRDAPAIVFCGVNDEPLTYGYPAPNVTGILERPHFEEGLNMLGRLLPQAQRLAIVSDDSPTSAGAIRHMKQAPAPWRIVSCETPRTWEQWRSAIDHAQTTADAIAIYMYHTIQSPNSDASMDPTDVMAWTVTNSRLPILGFFSFAVDDGALCGYLESGVEHGYEAGQLAVRICDGARPADLPIITALDGQSMVNLHTARRLGIDVPEAVLREAEVVVE